MRTPKLSEYNDYATWVTFEVMANYQVRVVLTNDLLKSAEGRLGSGPGEEADAFCYHVKGAGRSYIFLPMDAPESTVAHECWHIIHRVMTYCHVVDMDDEIIAYHLDHMVEQVYKFKNAIKSSTKKEVSDDQSKRRASSTKRH
jgi:hypothetical protein